LQPSDCATALTILEQAQVALPDTLGVRTTVLALRRLFAVASQVFDRSHYTASQHDFWERLAVILVLHRHTQMLCYQQSSSENALLYVAAMLGRVCFSRLVSLYPAKHVEKEMFDLCNQRFCSKQGMFDLAF